MYSQPIVIPIKAASCVSNRFGLGGSDIHTGRLVQGNRGRNDRQGAIQQTRGANACYSTRNNQHLRRGRHGTKKGAQLENGEEGEKGPLNSMSDSDLEVQVQNS